MKIVYPVDATQLIGPIQPSTADMIARTQKPGVVSGIQLNAGSHQIYPTHTVIQASGADNNQGAPNSEQSVAPDTTNGTDNPPLTTIQCQLCNFNTPSPKAMECHMSCNHSPIYSCNYCDFKTKNQVSINQHFPKFCSFAKL